MTGEPLVGELVEYGAGDGGALAQYVPTQLAEHVARWLAAVTGPNPSPHTLRAYVTDSGRWFQWCDGRGVDPLHVVKSHVDAYSMQLATTPTKRTGRPPANASVARAIATVASLYTYLEDEGLVDAHPVRRRARPKVSKDSTTRGLDRHEAKALRGRLRQESPTDRAIVETLLGLGVRVAELCELNVESLGFNAGAVVLAVHGKGDKTRTLSPSAGVIDAIDTMLDQRARAAGLDGSDQLDPAGPLFVRVAGSRWTQRAVCRLLVRVARAAGITRPHEVTPHVLRHTCATLLLEAGVSIHDVRDLLGHESVSTTERYDRARGKLSRTRVAACRLDDYTTPDQGE